DRKSARKYEGAEIRTIKCKGQGVVRSFEFMFKALRDSRSVKPDVIHFHSLAEGAALAGRIDSSKVLSYDFFQFRHGKNNVLHPLYRRALEKFTCLMPVSDYCLRESSTYWSLPAERMEVVYNGVSLQQFRPDAAAGLERRKAAGVSSDEF